MLSLGNVMPTVFLFSDEMKCATIPRGTNFYFHFQPDFRVKQTTPDHNNINMVETSNRSERDLMSLKATVESVSSLITQLLAAIKSEFSPKGDGSSEVKALDLAHDAATLIKAHSTKVSLLIINVPFTPTAITTVLRELSSGPLPALATSVELCDPGIYTKVMRSELKWRVEKVLVDFRALVGDIPLDGKVLSDERKNGTVVGMGKGSLATTGVVWGACDEVVELKKLGLGGFMIKKAEQYRDTVKDALEELQEWGEETSEDEEEDEIHEAAVGNGSCNPAQDAIDEMFQDQRHIPANDVYKVRERLECTLRRLKLISLLYQAIIKRRLKTLPAVPHTSGLSTTITCLDTLMPLMSRIPDSVDDLASAFYSLDDPGISNRMEECFSAASAAATVLRTSWGGKQDEFSVWSEKFVKAMAEEWT
jgi:hypothetical protein